MSMPNEETIRELRNLYPPGTRIRLIHMKDEWYVPDGSLGTVKMVDDIGTIHVCWDMGSSLGLIADEDEFEIIK